MRAAGTDFLSVAASLNVQQWLEPSAATGWSVQDVFIHVGSLLELLQAAVGGATPPAIGVEELNDHVVASRRQWNSAQTVQFLHEQLGSAIDTFSALQGGDVGETPVPMLDLGTYPLHTVADMFSFDLTTHLRYDVLRPRGPIASTIAALDEVRLTPAVAWLIAGLSQMQPKLASDIQGPILLRLNGPAARDLTLTTDRGAVAVVDPASSEPPVATITSSTQDFLAWSTKRLPWSGLVEIDGDDRVAATFLDAIDLV
jgi:hypothetical protein